MEDRARNVSESILSLTEMINEKPTREPVSTHVMNYNSQLTTKEREKEYFHNDAILEASDTFQDGDKENLFTCYAADEQHAKPTSDRVETNWQGARFGEDVQLHGEHQARADDNGVSNTDMHASERLQATRSHNRYKNMLTNIFMGSSQPRCTKSSLRESILKVFNAENEDVTVFRCHYHAQHKERLQGERCRDPVLSAGALPTTVDTINAAEPKLGTSVVDRLFFNRSGDLSVTLLPYEHSLYHLERSRMSSFAKIKTLKVSAIKLARNGFYYDEARDLITCFKCNLVKRHWDTSEKDITKIHLHLSPDCGFAKRLSDDEVNSGETGAPCEHADSAPSSMEQTRSRTLSSDNEEPDEDSGSAVVNTPSELSPSPHITQADSSGGGGNPAAIVCDQRASKTGPPGPHTVLGAGAELSRKDVLFANGAPQAQPTRVGKRETTERHPGRSEQCTETAPPTLPSSQRVSFDNFTTTPSVVVGQARMTTALAPVQAEQVSVSRVNWSGSCEPASSGESLVGLVDLRRAASPANATVTARLTTFANWPTSPGLPSSRVLVVAGYYYLGVGDRVRCFFCGVTSRDWTPEDDPWVTHVRSRFSCDYLTAIKGKQFVQETLVKIATGRTVVIPNAADLSTTPQLPAAQQTLPRLEAAASSTLDDRARPNGIGSIPAAAGRLCSQSRNAVGRDSAAHGNATSGPAAASDRQMPGNKYYAERVAGNARESSSEPSRPTSAPDEADSPRQPLASTSEGGSRTRAPNETGTNWVRTSQRSAEDLQTDAGPDRGRQLVSSTQLSSGTAQLSTGPTQLSTGPTQLCTGPTQLSTGRPPAKLAGEGAEGAPSRSSVGAAGLTSTTTRREHHEDQAAYLRQLQETNRRLRQQFCCRLCGHQRVNTIFLPCGHLCTCSACASTIEFCCLCNELIRATALVIMVTN